MENIKGEIGAKIENSIRDKIGLCIGEVNYRNMRFYDSGIMSSHIWHSFYGEFRVDIGQNIRESISVNIYQSIRNR